MPRKSLQLHQQEATYRATRHRQKTIAELGPPDLSALPRGRQALRQWLSDLPWARSTDGLILEEFARLWPAFRRSEPGSREHAQMWRVLKTMIQMLGLDPMDRERLRASDPKPSQTILSELLEKGKPAV